MMFLSDHTTSSHDYTNRETFRTEFGVANGVWEREVFGKDETMRKFGYDFSVDGSCYNTILNLTATRRESGTQDVVEQTTQEWQIDKLGNELAFPVIVTITETQVASQYFDMLHPTSSTSLHRETEQYDQEWASVTNRVMPPPDVMPPQGPPPPPQDPISESYTIRGTSSGMYSFSEGTYYDYQEFKDGVIYFDTVADKTAGKSSAITIINPDPLNASHGWIDIDYNDFTTFLNGEDQIPPKGKVIKRDFGAPHQMYLGSFTNQYSGSVELDFSGNGVGVTFPNATADRTSELFESGVEMLLLAGEVADYETPDLSGVPVGMPEFIFTSGGKGTPASSTRSKSSEAVQSIIDSVQVQKILDAKKTGYYVIIYVHTNNEGHAWLGAVHLSKDKDGNIIINETEYKGWGPNSRLSFGPGVITPHDDAQYDVARFYQLTQAQYDKLKEQMNKDQFNGKDYEWPNSNCVHWVEHIINEIKKLRTFPNPDPGLTIDGTTEVFPKPNSALADGLGNTYDHVKDKRVPLLLKRKLLQDLKSYPTFGHVPSEVKAQLQ